MTARAREVPARRDRVVLVDRVNDRVHSGSYWQIDAQLERGGHSQIEWSRPERAWGVWSIPGRGLLTREELKLIDTIFRPLTEEAAGQVWIGILVAQDTQTAPVPNDGPSMHDLAVQEILARKEIGLKEYGTFLQTGNGRNFFTDSIEEVGDLLCYLIGAREENRILQEYTVAHEKERAEQFKGLEEGLQVARERADKAELRMVEAENKATAAEQECLAMSDIIRERDDVIGRINEAKARIANVGANDARERARAVEALRRMEVTFEVMGLPFTPFVEAADVGKVIGESKARNERFSDRGLINA